MIGALKAAAANFSLQPTAGRSLAPALKPLFPDAGEYELSAVPDGSASDDLYMFAAVNAAGELSAVAQVLCNHPATSVWWIGLLVVAPSLRGRGLGSQLLRHVSDVVRAGGGHSLQLAVSLKNDGGRRFWQSAGFTATPRIVRVTARNGHIETVQVMTRELCAA